MTVNAQPPYTIAVGNGVSTVFPFTFKLLDESDLVVSVDGVAIPDTAYSISGLGENAGGDVTFLAAPAINADVFLERVIPFERVDDYQYSGDLKAEVLNPDFDRLWMAIQQIQSLFDRSIHFPAIESGITSELPSLSARLNNLLGFDENGELVAVAPAAQSATALQALLAQSSGSALVGFIQNLTGAVGITSQAKARQRVSVADFGIVPDGTTNWEDVGGTAWTGMLTAALTKTVVWPKGYYATSINLDSSYSGLSFHFEDGAIIGGVFHLISDSSPTTAAISAISRASNVVSVSTSSPHGYLTGQRVQIRNVYNTGAGSTSFNGDDFTITVTGASSFTYAQTGINESGTVTYGAGVNQRPIKNVTVTGRLTTTDRFGTINAKDCYVERVWVKSDTTQHSAYPGTTCRGAHLYVGTDNLHIEELIIDDASGSNTDAALAIDGNAWNPSNIKIDYCWIKDSDYHGAYITGGGHRFGELRIDGFARGVYSGTLQDSDGATQSQQVKAFWPNRAWDLEIGVLRTDQNPAGSRGYEVVQAVVDETGSAYFGKDRHGIHIGAWYARNVRRSGISFGDRVADSVRCNVTIGLMEIRLDPAGLTGGEFALRATGATGGSRVSIDTLRMFDIGANAALWTETTADVSIRRYEVISHTDRVLQARGRVNITDIHAVNSGSSSSNPIIHFSNPAILGSIIGSLHCESASNVSTRVLQADCGGWDVMKITTSGYRNSAGTIYIDTNTRFGIHAFQLVGPDSTQIGVQFNGANVDGYFGPGVVSGFSKGFAKGTATFTRCTGIGLNGNGNTTPTDLANGSFEMTGCNGLTL